MYKSGNDCVNDVVLPSTHQLKTKINIIDKITTSMTYCSSNVRSHSTQTDLAVGGTT